MINGKTNNREKVNELNVFFSEIGSKLAEQFDNDVETPILPRVPPIYELCQTNYETVECLPSNLGPSRAIGVDGLTSQLLQDARKTVIISLLYIINISIRTKTFPTMWKEGYVTPIHKESSRSSPNN